MVFLAGLPGTGKSLLLKQLVLIAQQAGRTVDTLQWDVTRLPFETADILALGYPTYGDQRCTDLVHQHFASRPENRTP